MARRMSAKWWSPSTIRPKLWVGSLIAVFAAVVFYSGLVNRHTFGLDFISFYRAGVLVKEHQAGKLYDLAATQAFDQDLARQQNLDLGKTYGAFFNPPGFAWLFAPLVQMGYFNALIAWEIFNLVCCIAATYLLCQMIPQRYDPDPNMEPARDWRDVALVPLLLAVSLPFIQSIGHAQNAFLSLLLMTCAVAAWRSGRGLWGGIAIGLLFYKPQLAAVILVAMALTLGWRVLAGAAASLGSLLLVNIITLPGTLTQYVTQLGPDVKQMLAAHSYLWGRHATFNGFWHTCLGHAKFASPELPTYLAIVSSVPVVFGIGACVWRNRQAIARDRMIAAIITATPLIMPYYLDYDLILLAIPAVLLAAEMIDRDTAQPLPVRDIWLMGLWGLLYVLLLVNPGLTREIQINLSVPVLLAVAGLMLARSLHPTPRPVWETQPGLSPTLPWSMTASRA